jgi:methionyl-tRNA formyltransferase
LKFERIAFIGNGWGAVSAVRSLKKKFSLTCVTNDSDVIALLDEDDLLLPSLNDVQEDLVIMAGWLKIITRQQLAQKTFINIHYSLLPKYRGLHALAWAILNGEENIGLSIHLVDDGIDSGPILHQKEFGNDDRTSLTEMTQRLNSYIEENLSDVIEEYMKKKIQPKNQNSVEASWVGRRGDLHNLIDFRQEISFYNRLIRVLQPPYPYPYAIYSGLKLDLEDIGFHFSSVNADKGRILNIDNQGVWVYVEGGYLILKKITYQGEIIEPRNLFKLGTYFEV